MVQGVRLRGEAGTCKSRVFDECLYRASLDLDSDQRALGFDAVHVLIVTPTVVLSDVYRRRWRTAESIIADTFDGAFDTLEQFVSTPLKLSQYEMWIIDEAEFLTPKQWKRLLHLHVICPAVFVLPVGDAGQFPPIGDDGGVGSGAFGTRDLTLREQLRFNANTPFGRLCSKSKARDPHQRGRGCAV